MKKSTKIKWSFAIAIIVSICWIIGDIFLVGFEPNPEDYPLFSVDYANKISDVGIAIHMLEASTSRLMFGTLIAVLTAPLLLPGMWLIYQTFIDKNKKYAFVIYWIFLGATVLYPLGHAVFFYLGEIFKAIYHTDKIAHPYLIETSNGFYKMFLFCWGATILMLLIAWLSFIVCILMKKTILPRWFVFFTPVVTVFILFFIKEMLPMPYSAWVGGGIFNVANLIFFTSLFILFKKIGFHFKNN